ncbi:MAG: S41 family peptidase [Planctomycetaceae bacterium]|nr:S41 family peptidase [Planctomycetaceae bacterium]
MTAKLHRLTVLAALALILALWPIAAAQNAPAPAATQPAATAAAAAPNVSYGGLLDIAVAGDFGKAYAAFQRLPSAGPDRQAALALLGRQVERSTANAREREGELDDAVARVKQAMLAQEHQEPLKKSGLFDRLRDAVGKLVLAYGEVGNGDDLPLINAEAAALRRTKTLESLDKLPPLIESVKGLVAAQNDPYAASVREMIARTVARLQDVRQAWQGADLKTPSARVDASGVLWEKQTDLALSITDIQGMVVLKPWHMALAQARLAQELAGQDHSYSEQDWYKTLIAATLARADKAAADARWFEALTAYSALEELAKDLDAQREQFYADKAKLARQHVRVLRLYGDAGELTAEEDAVLNPGATTRPASAKAEDSQTSWRDMTSGIDANMVKRAIERLNDSYVTTVDYRKVIQGSLQAVRVLATTPQAQKSFPLLSEAAQRDKFVSAIDAQLKIAQTRDNLDQLDLTLAMDSVLRASETSVRIPTSVLAMEFADGLLDELDRFSSMIWPYDVSDFLKQTMGEFFGVGVQITKEPGEPLEVVTPLPDSPGFRAGLKVGDKILKVDGRATEDLSVDKLVRMITGKKGSTVVLTITRAGMVKPIDVPIVRDEIHIRTVKGWRMANDGKWDFWLDEPNKIGYIRLTQFTDTSHSDMLEAIKELRAGGLKSLILDLRFDPGGLLNEATKIVDEFVSSGRIVSTRGRQVPESPRNAHRSGQFLSGDLVVLINEQSASASEIVSGALKDLRRATIVGRRSYGKGSVQNIIPLEDKKAFLKLTTAYYYLPSGRLLHRKNGSTEWGVDPDVVVGVTPRQMKRWQDIRRKTDLLMDIDPAALTDALKKQYEADIQLNSAVTLLRLKALRDALPGNKAIADVK